MTVSNTSKNSGDSFTLDIGLDSGTGHLVQKVVIAEPAGGTFVATALEGGNLATIKNNTAVTTAGTPASSGLPVQGMTGGVPVPVSGTFWQTTQPVSGTFWQTTQPVSIATMPSTPVTGTFWQTTQPVSIASMPSTPVTGTFWQATQPVSGTFWQATQPVSAAALPLPTGAATAALQPTAAAQGSTTSGQTGHLIQGAVTTAAPTYTTAQTSPLSLDTAGNLRVSIISGGGSGNVAQGSTSASNTGPMIQGAVTTAAPAYTTAQTNPLSLTTAGALRTDASATTQPVSAVSLPLPSGAATAAGLTTINTTLGTPMQATGGTVTANAGTNLNTSALALETGGNLASIKTNTALTAAGVTATSGQGVQGMTGGVALPVSGTFWQATQPVSNASLPLPTGAATSANQPTAAAQGSTTAGQTGRLIEGAVTTAAPTYTTAQTSPLSLDTAGNLRVNVMAGSAVGNVAQGSTTSGESGPMIQGAVTTVAPTYVTAQTSPLSLTTAGAVRTDASGTTQPISAASLPLPSGAALEAGGNLAAILTAATGPIPPGTALIGKVGIDQTTPGTTNAVQANAGSNLNTSALALETGGNLAALLATRTVTSSSTNSTTTVAAAIAAHISATAGQFGYLSSITISGLGATAAGAINCNIQGLLGGTRQFWINIPAGVGVALNPIQLSWKPALQSSAVNTLVQVNVPTFGAGNVEASVWMDGYTSTNSSPL